MRDSGREPAELLNTVQESFWLVAASIVGACTGLRLIAIDSFRWFEGDTSGARIVLPASCQSMRLGARTSGFTCDHMTTFLADNAGVLRLGFSPSDGIDDRNTTPLASLPLHRLETLQLLDTVGSLDVPASSPLVSFGLTLRSGHVPTAIEAIGRLGRLRHFIVRYLETPYGDVDERMADVILASTAEHVRVSFAPYGRAVPAAGRYS